ncbi:MAG: PAS domain S-box protein, partial [Desulfobacteraceae bacterium]
MEESERKNPECVNVDEASVPGSEERTTELVKANERLKQEVDKRKRAQAALEESERCYRDIFDNVSDFLYLHDLEGYILETNRAWATYGFDVEELRGLNIKHVLPERYRAEFESYLKRVLAKGKDEGLMNVMGRDGREFVVEYRNHLVVDSEGRPVAVRGSGRDVTERLKAGKEKKNLEKQLLRAQRLEALGTLAGGIAHNFNNLLMGIRGNASLG